LGVVNLIRAVRQPANAFNAGKRLAVMALTASLLMWLAAFIDVGGEWFLMWQSPMWNGQEEAFRMFVIVGLILLILLHADADSQA
jgi:predicted small integral membrane protein